MGSRHSMGRFVGRILNVGRRKGIGKKKPRRWRMFGLPMEIVGPVIGFGSIIMFVSAGIVMVRFFTSKIPHPDAKSRLEDAERTQMLEDIQLRLGEFDQLTQRVGELEERVDFTERLLAKQREGQRLEPPRE